MTMLAPLLVTALTFATVWRVSERRAADPRRRIAPYVRARAAAPADVLPLRREPLAKTEEQLARLPGWPRFVGLLERSHPGYPPTRLFWGSIAGLALGGLVGLVVFGAPIGALIAIALAAIGIRIWLAVRIQRRRRAFDDQLPELLTELASALRAGHGFNQALQAVAADAAEPAATEFGRVLAEARLGRPMDDALTDLGRRIDSVDLNFVLQAVIVQRQVGGSLAGIFDLVGETVRQRHQYALRLRSLTATGRMSALVLLALPIVFACFLSIVNHGYFGPLVRSGAGRTMIGAAFAFLVVGALWLKRIVAYDGAAA